MGGLYTDAHNIDSEGENKVQRERSRSQKLTHYKDNHLRPGSIFVSLGKPISVETRNYSQLSANGHSRKRTALFSDAFSNPRITSQSNSEFTHSRKWTLSHKRTRTLLEMKIVFFFCLRSLVSGNPIYNN